MTVVICTCPEAVKAIASGRYPILKEKMNGFRINGESFIDIVRGEWKYYLCRAAELLDEYVRCENEYQILEKEFGSFTVNFYRKPFLKETVG